MTATQTRPETDESGATAPTGPVIGRLVRVASEAETPAAAVREASEIIAEHFASPLALVSVRQGATEIEHTAGADDDQTAPWRRIAGAMSLDLHANPRPIGRLYGSDPENRIAVLAAPISGEGSGSIGAIVVLAACADRPQMEASLTELRAVTAALATALAAAARGRAGARVSATKQAEAVGRAGVYTSIHELAFAMTNNLRNKIGCDQVTFGLVDGPRVKILSISGLDDIKPRSPGAAAMRHAMEECLDLGRTLCIQNDDRWADEAATTGHRLHREWHETAGGASVASVPILSGERPVAVIALRRRSDLPFSKEELDQASDLLAPFGAAIPVVHRSTRSLVQHATQNVVEAARFALAPRGWGVKAIALAMALLMGWVAFGVTPYRVSVEAVVQSDQTVHFAAPFEGRIAEVHAGPGDRVTGGQVLCRFDTADLDLQAAGVRAELATIGIEIDQALAEGDVSAATLAAARRDVLVTRLAVHERRIDAATVRAPADGTLISGDIADRVGQTVPLGEPLFRFVPDDSLRVELLVPEHAADEVHHGLTGRFAAQARPEIAQTFSITHAAASAEIRDGKNVLPARAGLEDAPDWLRVGMEGVAKIDAGDRPVWWVAFHRIADAMHMRFWL